MGSSNYSDAVYSARIDHHTRSGTSAFVHDAAVKSGAVAAAVHDKLNPAKKNAAGKIIRESFDSDAKPSSRPVAICFDVTGSMAENPGIFIKKLDKLMAFLTKKGYLIDPHVLFAAYGDATCDKIPLQIGQFEGGNEMDEVLSLMVLESGGGGHITESGELAIYFLARHSDMHSVTKRGQKGYLFMVGDELMYPKVKRSEVKSLIGDDLEADISTEAILEEAREKFEIFWIIPNGSQHYNDHYVIDPLKKMFGQNLIKLDHPEDICEVITAAIGSAEGYDLDDMKKDLVDIGSSAASVDRATSALVPYTRSRALTKTATASGELVPVGSDSIQRL